MKIAFFAIFDPTWTYIQKWNSLNIILIFNPLERQKLYYYHVCDLKTDFHSGISKTTTSWFEMYYSCKTGKKYPIEMLVSLFFHKMPVSLFLHNIGPSLAQILPQWLHVFSFFLLTSNEIYQGIQLILLTFVIIQ